MGGPVNKLPPHKVAQIRALVALDLSGQEIAKLAGVSKRSALRYREAALLEAGVRMASRQDSRNPLYDPRRDGIAEPETLVGRLAGDPPPGRRELLARWRPPDDAARR